MTSRLRGYVASACIAACAVPFGGVTHGAATTGAQIVGVVTAPAGSSPSGWEVVLVNPQGDLVASGATAPSGSYELNDIPPGRYRFGVRDGEGRLGPVAGPDAQLTSGARLRQDIRLVESATPRLAPAAYGALANSWWDRQTRNQKIFTIVGIAVGAVALWAIVDAVTDDDDDETPASAFSPN